MRVLVTGADGFIGRQTLPLLLTGGYEVHAVTPVTPPEASLGVTWHQADLLDPLQVGRLVAGVQPSHLLHFAWYVVPGRVYTSHENYRWVRASLDLLEAFVQQGGERAVAAGSCAEYDWSYGYCSEWTTPLAPSTVYGACKHALQVMFEALMRQSDASGAWGRIFFLYGPHEHPERLVPSVIRPILQGQPARCSHGRQVRDYLHVQDVAGAFVTLLESDVQGAVNVGLGQPVVLKDIIYTIAGRLGRPDLVQLGAIPSPPGEPRLLLADTGRLYDEAGWQPHYDLSSGLDQTIGWWKARMAEPLAQEAA